MIHISKVWNNYWFIFKDNEWVSELQLSQIFGTTTTRTKVHLPHFVKLLWNSTTWQKARQILFFRIVIVINTLFEHLPVKSLWDGWLVWHCRQITTLNSKTIIIPITRLSLFNSSAKRTTNPLSWESNRSMAFVLVKQIVSLNLSAWMKSPSSWTNSFRLPLNSGALCWNITIFRALFSYTTKLSDSNY